MHVTSSQLMTSHHTCLVRPPAFTHTIPRLSHHHHHLRRSLQNTTIRAATKIDLEHNNAIAVVPFRSRPRGVIHFLGGAFVSAAPYPAYSALLNYLADRGYTVILTPYAVTFQHDSCARSIHASFLTAYEELQATRAWAWSVPSMAPIHGVGHSNGALMHVMIASLHGRDTIRNASNILLSYNNRQVSEAVPLPMDPLQAIMQPLRGSGTLESMTKSALGSVLSSVEGLGALDGKTMKALQREFSPAVTQLGSVFDEVCDSDQVEFSPTPQENQALFAERYCVEKTLLVKFADDAIDQTDVMERVLLQRGHGSKGPGEVVVSVDRLTYGNHLTPVGISPGELPTPPTLLPGSLGPAQALAQAAVSLSQADLRRVGARIIQWMDDDVERYRVRCIVDGVNLVNALSLSTDQTPKLGDQIGDIMNIGSVYIMYMHFTVWTIAHAIQIVGTLVLIIVPTMIVYWRSSINRAIKQKLEVKVTRDKEFKTQAQWHHEHPLLIYLELDKKIVATDFPHLNLLSLGEYMASLRPQGAFSLQRALISIMDRYGPRIALPLALFAPPAWKQDSPLPTAPSSLTNSPYAALMIRNMLSTMGLMTVSVLANRQNVDAKKMSAKVAADTAAATAGSAAAPDGGVAGEGDRDGTVTIQENNNNNASKKRSALGLMVDGGSHARPTGLATAISYSQPFSLPEDLETVSGVQISPIVVAQNNTQTIGKEKEEEKPMAPEPTPIHPIFPGLCTGNGGLRSVCTLSETKINNVLAVLLNRLAANSLTDVPLGPGSQAPTQKFKVQVHGHDAAITSVEEFMRVLEETGHTVTMSMTANMTSFGVGLCVKEEDESDGGGDGMHAEKDKYVQVPLAYPLSTGLYACDEDTGEDIDVVTLMQHSGINLCVRGGPVFKNAQLEWCLNIGGLTGWIPSGGIDREWAVCPEAKTLHAEEALSTAEGRRRALRLTTASAAVLNFAAEENQLLFGGYGSLGVCIDSVAAVEVAMTGGCTLYPLILGGDAKMGLLRAYKKIEKLHARENGAAGEWEYIEESRALQRGLLALPCDGIVEPGLAAATAKRALACLPKRSVFAGVERSRRALERALEVAEAVVG